MNARTVFLNAITMEWKRRDTDLSQAIETTRYGVGYTAEDIPILLEYRQYLNDQLTHVIDEIYEAGMDRCPTRLDDRTENPEITLYARELWRRCQESEPCPTNQK